MLEVMVDLSGHRKGRIRVRMTRVILSEPADLYDGAPVLAKDFDGNECDATVATINTTDGSVTIQLTLSSFRPVGREAALAGAKRRA